MYFQLQPSDEDEDNYLEESSLECGGKMLEDINLIDTASASPKFSFLYYDFSRHTWAQVKRGFELPIPPHRTVLLRSLEVHDMGDDFDEILEGVTNNPSSTLRHQSSNMNDIARQRGSVREQQHRAVISAAPPSRSQSTGLAPRSDPTPDANKGKGVDYSHLDESSPTQQYRGRSLSPTTLLRAKIPSTPSPQRRTQSMFSPRGPKPTLKPLLNEEKDVGLSAPTGHVTIKVETIDLTLDSPPSEHQPLGKLDTLVYHMRYSRSRLTVHQETAKRKRRESSESLEEEGSDIFTVKEDHIPSDESESQSDESETIRPKAPSWPGDYYTRDMIKFFKAVVSRQESASVDQVFREHFPDTRFVSTTYYEHRNRWLRTPAETLKKFSSHGRTKDGLWSCLMAVTKDSRAEYKSAQKRAQRKKRTDTPAPPPQPPTRPHPPRHRSPPPMPGPSAARYTSQSHERRWTQYSPHMQQSHYRQESGDYYRGRY